MSVDRKPNVNRNRRGLREHTHYDYLDLPPGATPAQIETAYVGLLERFGYGTTTDAGQDMSGLVTMIHAAHEALSNPEARNRYDAALAREAAVADAELKAMLDQAATDARSRAQDRPAWRDKAFVVIAA
jgi:DnaJ-class molecular chaperone